MPNNYWGSMLNQRRFFDSIADQLKIESQAGWYKVTNSDIEGRGVALLDIQYNNSIIEALEHIYPGIEFTFTEFTFTE